MITVSRFVRFFIYVETRLFLSYLFNKNAVNMFIL